MEGDIQNGLYFSGDVWVDESVGGATSSCIDWSILREEPGEELSSSSVYNLSIVNTGASVIHETYPLVQCGIRSPCRPRLRDLRTPVFIGIYKWMPPMHFLL